MAGHDSPGMTVYRQRHHFPWKHCPNGIPPADTAMACHEHENSALRDYPAAHYFCSLNYYLFLYCASSWLCSSAVTSSMPACFNASSISLTMSSAEPWYLPKEICFI